MQVRLLPLAIVAAIIVVFMAVGYGVMVLTTAQPLEQHSGSVPAIHARLLPATEIPPLIVHVGHPIALPRPKKHIHD